MVGRRAAACTSFHPPCSHRRGTRELGVGIEWGRQAVSARGLAPEHSQGTVGSRAALGGGAQGGGVSGSTQD